VPGDGRLLSDEQRQLRQTAREFAQRELEPHAEHWDRNREFPAAALRALAELGFLGLLVPEEEGGSGFDAVGFCLAVEEISRAVPALGLLLSIHNGPVCHLVRSAAAGGARARWLPRLASGDVLGAFALSELQAGSDVAAVATTYRRSDGAERAADTARHLPAAGGGVAHAGPAGFVLEGEKAWVSGAGRAGLAVVFARDATASKADPGAREEGPAGDGRGSRGRERLSAFLVDLRAAGVGVGPAEETMGLRAVPVGGLRLEAVELEADALLGREGAGFALAQEALAMGRLGIAAQSLGIAGRCLELAVAYARERRQFGRPVAEFQGVRLPLAELAARLEAARALLRATAARLEAPEFRVRAAMAKLVASELAMATALQAVQAHGGYGYVKDYPVERFFRDAKACQIYEGTSEIQRVVIAKELFQ
jgi:alkylation response protein AidB-like acyl-CoA dehydrogenase